MNEKALFAHVEIYTGKVHNVSVTLNFFKIKHKYCRYIIKYKQLLFFLQNQSGLTMRTNTVQNKTGSQCKLNRLKYLRKEKTEIISKSSEKKSRYND